MFVSPSFSSKGVRAKPHKWQIQQQSVPSSTSETKEPSEEQALPLSTTKLTVPDEMDLRPGIKNNGQSSPNLRRRQRIQQQKTNQEKFASNHKRTVSLQDIMQEGDSCQNIPEVSEIRST